MGKLFPNLALLLIYRGGQSKTDSFKIKTFSKDNETFKNKHLNCINICLNITIKIALDILCPLRNNISKIKNDFEMYFNHISYKNINFHKIRVQCTIKQYKASHI